MMATTIPVDPGVRDRLKTFGQAGMTYDEILTRLMDLIEQHEFVVQVRRDAARLSDDEWVDLDEVE